MQPLKIIITLLVLVIFGIIVGSNLSVLMTVVVLSQPTVALPIGIWLIIAVGLGILSSSLIQLLVFLQQRSLTKKIRQLQTRLQAQDEDIFTYTSSANPASNPEPKIDPTSSRNRFSFGRNQQQPTSNQSSNFSTPPPAKPSGAKDLDDWEDEPIFSRQMEWDDLPSPQQQTVRTSDDTPAYSNSVEREQLDFRSRSNRQSEGTRTEEIYDADFRLIQPPYKQPPDEEDPEYIDEEYDDPVDFGEPIVSRQSNPQSDIDTEDWGFDFDDEDPEVENSKFRDRRN